MGRTKRIRARKEKKNINAVNVSSDPSMIKLVQWIKSYMEKTPNYSSSKVLQLAHFQCTGRGLQAKQYISSGSVLVSIPNGCLMTRKSALDSLPNNMDDTKLMSTQLLLSLHLLQEKAKGQKSKWNLYMQTLPTSYTVPYFNIRHDDFFLPAYMYDVFLEQRNTVETAFVKAKMFLKDLDKAQFTWAWFTVNTRAVYYPDGGLALAPFLDMFNHSFSVETSTCSTGNNANNCYQIVTKNVTRKKKQVFINYGPHDNLKLYTEYGFCCLPHNPHDVVPVLMQDIVKVVVVKNFAKIETCKKWELDRKMYISDDGQVVSYNVLACIHVLSSSDDEEIKHHKVYEQVTTDLKSNPVLVKFVEQLLYNKLQEVKRAITTLVTEQNTVLKSLLEIHCSIIERAVLALLYVNNNASF